MREKIKQLFIKISIMVFILLLVIIFTPFTNWLAPLFYIEPNIQKADAIVVLSGGTYPDGTLSASTLQRTVDGIVLFKNKLAKKMIFVGNSGEKKVSDAQTMKELAIKMGTEEDDIIIGTSSADTYSNILETKEIMRDKNINTGLLVTSSTHMKRALLVSSKQGLILYPASLSVDKYRHVSVDRLVLFWSEVRESLALAIYAIKGYI